MIKIDEIAEKRLAWAKHLQKENEKLEAEVGRLRGRLIRAYDWAENMVNGNDSAMMDYTEYVCGDDEAAWKRYLNTYDELLAKVERLRKREATFDAFIDSLDCHNEHEWMLIERIDEIDERLHGGDEE